MGKQKELLNFINHLHFAANTLVLIASGNFGLHGKQFNILRGLRWCHNCAVGEGGQCCHCESS